MGIIVRNLSSSGLSNVRVSKLYDLDEYGIVDGKKMYYLVPKINHTQQSTLDADESIVYNEQGEYFIPWNGFHPVNVKSDTNANFNGEKWRRVGAFNRLTSSSSTEPILSIWRNSNITTSNPAILNMKFTKPVLVNHLHLRNRQLTISGYTYTASFRDFTLEGSNDNGSTWDTLLTVVDKANTLGGQFNYSMIDNKKVHGDYRFVVTRTHNHSTNGLRVTMQSQINLLTTNDKS